MRKYLFYFTLFFLSVIMFTNCSEEDAVDIETPLVIEDLIPNHEGVVYELNFFKMKTGEGVEVIQQFLDESQDALDLFGGRQLVDVLALTDPLIQNDALPSVARSFETDFVVIHSFPNEEAFQKYSNEKSFKEAQSDLDIKVAEQLQLLNIAAPSPPGAPTAPEFGLLPPRPAPAFYLMNFLTLKPDSTSFNDFNTYLELNTPRILSSETVFSQPFSPALVLKGAFQMPVIFINFAEFKDDDAFDLIHNDPDAVQNIFPLRNEALADFVEARLEIAQ